MNIGIYAYCVSSTTQFAFENIPSRMKDEKAWVPPGCCHIWISYLNSSPYLLKSYMFYTASWQDFSMYMYTLLGKYSRGVGMSIVTVSNWFLAGPRPGWHSEKSWLSLIQMPFHTPLYPWELQSNRLHYSAPKCQVCVKTLMKTPHPWWLSPWSIEGVSVSMEVLASTFFQRVILSRRIVGSEKGLFLLIRTKYGRDETQFMIHQWTGVTDPWQVGHGRSCHRGAPNAR